MPADGPLLVGVGEIFIGHQHRQPIWLTLYYISSDSYWISGSASNEKLTSGELALIMITIMVNLITNNLIIKLIEKSCLFSTFPAF
jgi:hypothetical protein